MKQISSGIPGLDVMLNGGLPVKRNILVSGSCGTGKTTFCMQFVQDGIVHGQPCLYISFEEEEDKIREDMMEFGINMDKMKSSGKFKMIGGPIGRIKRAQTKTKAKSIDVIEEIISVVKEMKAERVVLDSINLFMMLFDEDSEKRDALTHLSSELSRLGCTTLMNCEVEEGSRKISRYGFEEFATDGVIMLYRIPFDNMFERAISVIKMRGINHSKSIRALRIEDSGVKVYPDQEPYHKITYTF